MSQPSSPSPAHIAGQRMGLRNPEVDRFQGCLDDRLGGTRRMRVLDAGCGRYNRIRVGVDPEIAGIDTSRRLLDLNASLSERLVGDIQDVRPPSSSFDAIVCCNVLEHLPQPELALANFVGWGREGGFIVIAVPNLRLLKGLVTKFTPHRFGRVRSSAWIWVFPSTQKTNALSWGPQVPPHDVSDLLPEARGGGHLEPFHDVGLEAVGLQIPWLIDGCIPCLRVTTADFSITWASAPAPTGYFYDVLIRRPGQAWGITVSE